MPNLLNTGDINKYVNTDINSTLQYSLTNAPEYSSPIYQVSKNPSAFLDAKMRASKQRKMKNKESKINTRKFVDELNTLRHSLKYGSQLVVENYDSLGPLQRLNLMSCGDTANWFLEDISGANMGDGTGIVPPGPSEGCPAGDSKFNIYASKFKVL